MTDSSSADEGNDPGPVASTSSSPYTVNAGRCSPTAMTPQNQMQTSWTNFNNSPQSQMDTRTPQTQTATWTDSIMHVPAGTPTVSPGVFRSNDAIRSVADAAGLQCPNLIRTSNMRKYMATMLQALNTTETERQWVLDHLGHTMDVHKIHYRATSDVLERIKASWVKNENYIKINKPSEWNSTIVMRTRSALLGYGDQHISYETNKKVKTQKIGDLGEITLKIDENVPAKPLPSRKLLLSLQDVKKETDRLVEGQGLIPVTEPSKWLDGEYT
ncbi:unnamed protein product [Mytilus edulis]|uniref:Uncharacterized protein n=1 Tax=Mytilus edulis TaxID=6550 RepID=A0A8S3UJP7_MYTED|nr:unnamed protein product [Mytilus edulis]